MSFSKLAVMAGAALVSTVAAHGHLAAIKANGVWYEGYDPSMQYEPVAPIVAGWSDPQDLSNGFIAPSAYGTDDIICHLGATNAKTYVNVTAGSPVTLAWTPLWPVSHKGPVCDYLASCTGGDCTTVDKTTLQFFKIDEVGLIDDTTIPGKWASDILIANNNSWTVTIPPSLARGPYVLRHEIIALHNSEQPDGAQNYPQCINLWVSGTGSAVPASSDTTLGTALYKSTDPGVNVNIYAPLASYDIPGPTLWSGASGAAATGAASPAVASPAVASPAVASPAVASPDAVISSAPASSAASSAAASSLAQTSAATSPVQTSQAQPVAPSSSNTYDATSAVAAVVTSAPAVTGGSNVVTEMITDYVTVTDVVTVTVTA